MPIVSTVPTVLLAIGGIGWEDGDEAETSLWRMKKPADSPANPEGSDLIPA